MTGARPMSPAERILCLLARMAAEPQRVWEAERLRHDIPGYQPGERGDRNWRHDCKALRDRGLIETGLTTRHTRRRTGVRLASPAKPDDLYLSEQEHAALIRARRDRGGSEMPNPLDGDTTRGGPIEDVAAALRRLEEQGKQIRMGDLARDMGVRPDRLLPLLRLAWALEVDHRSVFDNVLDIDDSAGADVVRAADVKVKIKRRKNPDRPLRDTGLALLGAGAYTLAEIEERLTLIDHALQQGPDDAAALESARSKLQRWRQIRRAAHR